MKKWSGTVPDMWTCWHLLITSANLRLRAQRCGKNHTQDCNLHIKVRSRHIRKYYMRNLSPGTLPSHLLSGQTPWNTPLPNICLLYLFILLKYWQHIHPLPSFLPPPFIYLFGFIVHTCFSFCKKKSTSASHTHKHVQKNAHILTNHTHITMNFCTISTPILHSCLMWCLSQCTCVVCLY